MSDENKGVQLTHSQSVNRLREIQTELERLVELDAMTPEDETYFAELREDFERVDAHRKNLERQADLARIRSAAQGLNGLRLLPGSTQPSSSEYDRDAILEPDSVESARFRNPWDLSEVRTFGRDAEDLETEYRSRAMSAIEKMPGASDNVRAAAQKVLDMADKPAVLARQILVTSSPEYLRAWSKCARGQSHLMTAEESRAMSLTDASGGYLVPFQLDPTVIITSDGSRNDIRQAARQVVATGDKWNGVSSGQVSWSWDGEAAEVSDDSTTFAQPSINVYKAQGFVPISIEALEDEQNVTAEVARLLAFGKDSLESAAFATGTGTNQPIGIVTALTGGSSEVAAATADTFAIADVYAVHGALPARYRANASWLANNLIYNKIRQFDTAGGAGLWTTLGNDRPPGLIGRDVLESEDMDGTITALAANYALIFGDFSNYVIADRVGTRVEFIQHLFATANNRPSGQRGWYAYYRVGADSVNDGAFRMLNV